MTKQRVEAGVKLRDEDKMRHIQSPLCLLNVKTCYANHRG